MVCLGDCSRFGGKGIGWDVGTMREVPIHDLLVLAKYPYFQGLAQVSFVETAAVFCCSGDSIRAFGRFL